MWATTAWDDPEWSGNQARGWTVMGRLRERQLLHHKEAADARRRIARREAKSSVTTVEYMALISQEIVDSIKARWQGGPTVLAFLFAPPDSDAIRMLDARGKYFDVRTDDTWDLFFPGYYQSTKGSAFERQKGALPIGKDYTGDWYFSPAGFNDLRVRIEQSSENRWQYSGGTDLVLINGWLVEQGEPVIDWASTISGQVTDQSTGIETLTLGNVIERITRDLEAATEDKSYGVAEITDEPVAPASHAGRDFMIQALSGIAAALAAKQLGA
jgi:hypothetical protein